MLQIISYIAELRKKKFLLSQRYLAGYRIDYDARRGRQPAAAPVDARPGPQIEEIAVPWAAQDPVLRGGLVERPEPVRANRRVSDEFAVLELEDAERLSIELHEERQPRSQLGQQAERERCPGYSTARSRSRQQSLPAHHHRFVLVPEAGVARPVFLTECRQPFRPLLGQIKAHLDRRPMRPLGIEQGPNLSPRTL